MPQKKHFYFFIGTTAEFIKIAPIIKELQKRKLSYKIIASGQNIIHFEDFSKYVGIVKADIQFSQKVNKSSMYRFILWAIQTLLTCFIKLGREFSGLNKENTFFIIHGDTVTSSIGAIVAKFFRLKLVLIECGDLSFNLMEPFPEEICRNINLRLADILFPPNTWAQNNLKGARGKIVNTKYNTLIESFKWAMKTSIIDKKITKYKNYYILILHRQEHVIFRKDWSKEILNFVIKNSNKNLTCILLNHPLTVNIIKSLNLNEKNKRFKIVISPAFAYPDFMKLMSKSKFIASDSAFNQLESYLMGKPFLALRDITEQVEGLNENVVVCESNFKIMKNFLLNFKRYQIEPKPTRLRPSKIIVDYLINYA